MSIITASAGELARRMFEQKLAERYGASTGNDPTPFPMAQAAALGEQTPAQRLATQQATEVALQPTNIGQQTPAQQQVIDTTQAAYGRLAMDGNIDLSKQRQGAQLDMAKMKFGDDLRAAAAARAAGPKVKQYLDAVVRLQERMKDGDITPELFKAEHARVTNRYMTLDSKDRMTVRLLQSDPANINTTLSQDAVAKLDFLGGRRGNDDKRADADKKRADAQLLRAGQGKDEDLARQKAVLSGMTMQLRDPMFALSTEGRNMRVAADALSKQILAGESSSPVGTPPSSSAPSVGTRTPVEHNGRTLYIDKTSRTVWDAPTGGSQIPE